MKTVMVTSPLAAAFFVNSGKARLLATTGRTPDPRYPELPTVSSVLPGYELTQWFGLLVRSGTPEPVVQRIAAALAATLKDPKVVETLKAQSFEAKPMGPRDFQSYIAQRRAYYANIIRTAGLQPQ